MVFGGVIMSQSTPFEAGCANLGNAEAALTSRRGRRNTASSSEIDQSDGRDSGYASVATSGTPESYRSGFTDEIVLPSAKLWPRKTTKLVPFDKPISPSTWDRFNDLNELFSKDLNDYLTKSRRRYRAFGIKLKVLGENEADSKPWIVVLCDQEISGKVKQFFSRKNVKSEYQPSNPDASTPFFEFIVCERPPRPIAATGPINVYGQPKLRMQSSHTLCGTVVRVEQDGEGERMATIGGLIKVSTLHSGAVIYGMTAGHVVSQDIHDTERENSDDEDDGQYENDASVDLLRTDMEVFELDFSSPEEISESVPRLSISELEDQRHPANSLPWPKIGNIEVVSQNSVTNGGNLDWALVALDDLSFCFPNVQMNLDSDAYFSLTQRYGCRDPGGPDKDVLISGGASGLKAGTLSMNYSYLMLAPGEKLVKTFCLRLNDGSGKPFLSELER
jgi:hypothetical protein